ncbi:hypothetical protein F5X96DRAFT_150551 [Biscogniauxia mediterranea]|nr:hypothetical protein F5X96DRAFT_150551 [Biscogniauxia mediterranea]
MLKTWQAQSKDHISSSTSLLPRSHVPIFTLSSRCRITSTLIRLSTTVGSLLSSAFCLLPSISCLLPLTSPTGWKLLTLGTRAISNLPTYTCTSGTRSYILQVINSLEYLNTGLVQFRPLLPTDRQRQSTHALKTSSSCAQHRPNSDIYREKKDLAFGFMTDTPVADRS